MSVDTITMPAEAAAEANRALVRRLIEAQNRRDEAARDEILAHDYFVHPFGHRAVSRVDGALVSEGGLTVTPDMPRRADARQRETWPEWQITIDALFAVGDAVVAVATHRGVHRSGRPFTGKQVAIYRIAGGRIAEVWALADRLGMYEQLGLVPDTPELARRAEALR